MKPKVFLPGRVNADFSRNVLYCRGGYGYLSHKQQKELELSVCEKVPSD